MAADDRAEFDPKEIASAAFPTAFRGYDQEAVRQYLTRLAAAVGRAQQLGILGAIDHEDGSAHLRAAEAEREAAELRARVAELEALIESGLDGFGEAGDATDATAEDTIGVDQPDLADAEPVRGPVVDESATIDEAELIELLGHETAKILEAARSAAADITTRARGEAAQIERSAEQDARTVRDDAEHALAAARVEAKRIVTSATDEAAQIQERLEAEAQRAYDDARSEADRIVTEASAKVEHDLAAARMRADQLVADAEGVREEVLGDLVRRRRVHRSQLSRLTDARDRLARSLATARSELDEVATTIDVATGSGSIDLSEPEPSSEALDTEAVADLIARLDRARADAVPVEARNGVHATVGANGTDDDTLQLRAGHDHGGDQSPGARGGVVVQGTSEVNGAAAGHDDLLAPDDLLGHDDLLAPDDTAADPAFIVTDGPPPGRADVDEAVTDVSADEPGAGEPASDGLVAEEEATIDLTAELAADTDTDTDYRAQAAQAIDELNGPIDGDRLLDQLGFADERVLGTDGVITRNEARGDLPSNAPYAGRLPELFEHRDAAMTKATPGFRRRLKRAVNDDQSDVLDRLRAGSKHIDVDELPDLDEQLTGYIAALTPALRDVVMAGARLMGSDDAPLPAVDNLCLQLAKHIVDNLRLATVDVIETSTGTDREAILDPIRAIYRDFRNTLLPDLIDDALHEAFALGVYHGIDADGEVLWVVDPRLDADPICEDNSASAPLPKGTEFPSGHARPLSMPGCRCLAVPAG